MTEDVISVGPDPIMGGIAAQMVKHHISAVPILGAGGKNVISISRSAAKPILSRSRPASALFHASERRW